MTRYAIIMSVENYEHFSPTKFTHADSNLIFHTLTGKCDYAEQHTIVFKLSPKKTKSPNEILSEIKRAVENSTSGDSVLFYFAGHGHYQDGKTYLILPNTVPGAYETTAIALEDLSKELRVPERACFRIFDACHSGTDVRDDAGKLDSESFIRSINHDASGWVTLAGCKDDQFSISDASIGQGLFTYYLCEEMSSFKPDQPIYPEILKVNISDKVLEHAKSLGYTQTPTLNASISGNISIATRRADVTSPAHEETADERETNIDIRIARLAKVKDVLTNEHLENVLNMMTEKCAAEFRNAISLPFEITVNEKIRANDIPEKMHSSIVDFSKNIGIKPRHDIKRYEEEYDDPYDTYFGALSALYPRKKRKRIFYDVRQPDDMPNSATIIDFKGDGRCLPDIKVLLYLIPLQITGCMLVSVFNCGWRNRSSDIELIKNFYQMLKPDDSEERINEIGPFSANSAMEKITNIVEKRVALLERELSE
ncbi:hypothetical protein CR161_11520 [Prosthecochloris sp. ZM]|uniref:caspase family protein n=1 Tax=Prosthecochloris sp. ZM TaxID=2283143 RepID=UPI000DF8247F|nr:caspase family protein [Prosthecochloris sp. ZM]RDD31274.1 hypothetical protein CR161_11520 [Prosthecochloris sp. ZM]